MVPAKRFLLRLFLSHKYITANVVDRKCGRVVASATTAEQALKDSLECGRASNAKAAAVVGEVLAMRLKVEGIGIRSEGSGDRGPNQEAIYADVGKEIQKKGHESRTKVWAVINALKDNGVKLVLEDRDDQTLTSLPPRFR